MSPLSLIDQQRLSGFGDFVEKLRNVDPKTTLAVQHVV